MDKEEMLKRFGLKTMFMIKDDEMIELIKEYEVFMDQVSMLDKIDTSGVEPLDYPYEMETTYLREDMDDTIISNDDALKNAKDVLANQIKVPKVV